MSTTQASGKRAVEQREPLRLRMGGTLHGRDRLHGGWWPHSRELAVEVADLVDHFPAEHGRITRALYSPPDWDGSVRRLRVRSGFIKVGHFPRDDTHVILLTTSDREVLRVLVVPPSFTDTQGNAALAAAADDGNIDSASTVLETVTHTRTTDPLGGWDDDGGS